MIWRVSARPGIKLDGVLCHTFLAAYRSILPLSVDELETVAAVYGWMRTHDLGHYKALYLKNNQRVRAFFQAESGPFVPFEKQWANIQNSLRTN